MSTTQAFVGRNVAWGMDQYDLSGQGNELKAKRDSAVIDATGFGMRFSNDLSGIQKASMEVKGHYAPGQVIDQVINQKFGQDSDVLGWYAPLGTAVGKPLVMQPSVITKYDVDAKLKGGVEIDLTMDARGRVDDGWVYVSPQVFTTVTGMSAVVDNTTLGGATAAGGAGYLYVWAATGTTPSMTAKIQHSPDGTTWTDLITFNALLTAGAQQVVLPSQTSVFAQTRASWTISGTTPSFVMMIGFARGIVYS